MIILIITIIITPVNTAGFLDLKDIAGTKL